MLVHSELNYLMSDKSKARQNLDKNKVLIHRMLLHNGLNFLMSDKSKIRQARQKLENYYYKNY